MINKETKKLIKSMATDSIWSAKGHFKTSQWIGYRIFLLISVPFITSTITLIFALPEIWIRIVSFIGVLFTFFTFLYSYVGDQSKGKIIAEKHRVLANKYLALYNELKQGFHFKNISDKKIQRIKKEIDKLNQQSSTCEIDWIGRLHCNLVIKREVDMKWLR